MRYTAHTTAPTQHPGAPMTTYPRRLALSRRQFVPGAILVGLGLMAGCRRLPAQPPQAPAASGHVPRIGFLAAGPAPTEAPLAQAFRDGLREFGYVDGDTISIEYRYPDRAEQFREFAADLAQLPVDIIMAGTQPAAEAAKAATTTIPIVMATATEPLGSGLIASFAHPGGNVTG